MKRFRTIGRTVFAGTASGAHVAASNAGGIGGSFARIGHGQERRKQDANSDNSGGLDRLTVGCGHAGQYYRGGWAMKTEKCKICGTEIERKGPGCKPKYCDACRAERRRASQRKTYHKKEEQRKAQEAMHKLAPARSLSMNELLRELEQFNAKRRQMGLDPVSYGRYVAFREASEGPTNEEMSLG